MRRSKNRDDYRKNIESMETKIYVAKGKLEGLKFKKDEEEREGIREDIAMWEEAIEWFKQRMTEV